MLKNVIIMTGAGVVIFEKVWVDSESVQTEKGRLLGSLITTMLEFSRQSTGLIVSYLEFSEVAISIVDDSKTKLICTLFHEKEDGADFGQMIATQILRSFIENFSEVSFTGTLNVKTFSGFTSKLFDAIQNSIRSIVQNLQTTRGITTALVVYDDGTAVMPPQLQEEDQLGIIANLQPLITFSTDIISSKKDRPECIHLEMERHIVFINKVSDISLVSICKKSIKYTTYMPAIQKALIMLDKVLVLSRSLLVEGKY
jgi:hypothetical protein